MADQEFFQDDMDQDNTGDWRVDSLTHYTELDAGTVQDSFKIFGDGQANILASTANANAKCPALLACTASVAAIGMGVSAAVSEWTLCGAFAAAAAALVAGTVSTYQSLTKDSAIVKEKIRSAAAQSRSYIP